MSQPDGQRAKAFFERTVQLAQTRLVNKPDDLAFLPYLGLNLARTGQPLRAVAEIEKALQIAPDNPELRFYEALILELTGHRRRAIELLRRSYQGGYSVFYVSAWPELADLRADPAYTAVINELSLNKDVGPGSTSGLGPASGCASAPSSDFSRGRSGHSSSRGPRSVNSGLKPPAQKRERIQ